MHAKYFDKFNGECEYPPFLESLLTYVSAQNSTFACPGHQGTEFFKKHPAGRAFLEFFGENVLRADVPHADPMLGEVLTHQGPPGSAQKHAAKVFNSDQTYFVLNGTSTSNKIVASALIAPGDLILFDRNNHKSCYHGALIQAGGIPIYLEATRNSLGMIGGIPTRCFNEDFLRAKVATIDSERADKARPFRLAILQFGTCDGLVADAREIVRRIGPLCEYILFDSAWLGYEQFIASMKELSPLMLDLKENDPGIIVTQSVHKQLAGFSQASQIHKKDQHISAHARFCNHERFNNAFMMHSSTSPFYPIFASLDVNAKMHGDGEGEKLWQACMQIGIEARKLIFEKCRYLRPFVPPMVDGRPWQDYPTSEILSQRKFFACAPNASWHSFEGYGDEQFVLDPCKLILSTLPVEQRLGSTKRSFPLPASILAHYLRQHGVIPEKSELRIILFLLTPALDMKKINNLAAQLLAFEDHLINNAPLTAVFPKDAVNEFELPTGARLNDLCAKVYALHSKHATDELLRAMFMNDQLPEIAMSPREANLHMVKGSVELIPLQQAHGRIAAEGALPYPPGMLCIAPGERWGGSVLRYFMAVEELLNEAPTFAPSMQGVYPQVMQDGRIQLCSHVVQLP